MLKKLTLRLASHIAHSGLPLLSKELTEQAARKRTFVIRVVYATVLFLMASLFFYQTLQYAVSSPLAVLGHGKEMFASLVGIQFAGIYFFMPAMTCSVITQEKERASLQLLFLTRLGPWTILFEKLLGRLVPMGCFLLLSLPLMGFAYTLGGVSREMLWKATWMLFLATIQMGTLALMCSAFFRTTVVAFLASYVIAFVMFFGPYLFLMTAMLVGWTLKVDFERVFSQLIPNSPGFFMTALFPLFTPPHFLMDTLGAGGFGMWTTVAHSTMVLGSSAGFLLLSRRFLVDRAFLPAGRPLRLTFGARRRRPVASGQAQPAGQPATAVVADVSPANDSGPGLRELVGYLADAEVAETLPVDEPVAWRETTKRALGDARHLWIALLVIEIPLVLLCIFLGFSDREFFVDSLITIPLRFLMWLLAVLIISVKSASLIASERTHQTLDVLCTSPLTGREIVLQKFRGVRRVIFALWGPFLTVSLFVPWWIARERHQYIVDRFSAGLYLVCAVLSILIYFPLIAWLSLLIGLRLKTQIRAIIGSMAAIAAWCIAPLVFMVLPIVIMANEARGISVGNDDWEYLAELVSLLSPATIVFVNEAFGLREYPGPWLSVWLNFAFYGIALVAFRAICLKNADRWLGRATANEEVS